MPTGQIRTTVYLDENLYLAAKKKAVEERTTLTDLIKTGLKDQIFNSYKVREKPYKDILEMRGIFKTKKRIPFRKIRKAFEEALGKGEV